MESISISLHGHGNAAKSKGMINPQPMNNKSQVLENQREFTIDEDFFSTVILPSIYGTVISGIKQHLVPTFNLTLSVLVAFKKKEITEPEFEFFFK